MSQLIIYVISFVQLTNYYVEMFAGENIISTLFLTAVKTVQSMIGMCK